MITLEEAGPESIDTLVRLWRKSFVQAYEAEHTSENLSKYCEKNFTDDKAKEILSSEASKCVIAAEGQAPSGFYVLLHQDCPVELDGRSSELKQIYVLAEYYGKGLGKKLYDHAVQSTKDAGRHWLWLCVSDLNFRAQSFYKKLGFDAVGQGPELHVGSDVLSSTLMAHRL
ncbi:MAG: GNAT family N-acetyltransferase [Pseudomonadales bacterium]|nr:GNAT family N-acetyltransferase [Pseudomonadales bacterium]